MRVFPAAMSAIAVLLIGSAQAKDCRGPHFNLVDGGTTEAVLYISTDKICDIHFEMPSSDRGWHIGEPGAGEAQKWNFGEEFHSPFRAEAQRGLCWRRRI
jgi:hypothetical protein